jgi:septin family protein
LQAKINEELTSNGVHIYQFPTDDESVSEINGTMNAHIPFAVVGSTDFVKIGSKNVRARQYPWGTVQVENEAHCDFVKLREMLIRTNMEDMREKTHTKHYELYRQKRLEQMGFTDVDSENKPVSFQQTFEAKRTNHLAELQAKEDEVRQMFVVRVKEKEAELKDNEKDVSECRSQKLRKTFSIFSFSVARQVRQVEKRPCRGEAQAGRLTQETRRGICRIYSSQDQLFGVASHADPGQEQKEIDTPAPTCKVCHSKRL